MEKKLVIVIGTQTQQELVLAHATTEIVPKTHQKHVLHVITAEFGLILRAVLEEGF